MVSYRSGDIVLISFPFADATGAKRRPALVLLDTADDDIIAARVTSHAPLTVFDVELAEWQREGLLAPSVARVHKLATLERRLVECKLGTLTPGDGAKVRAGIQRLWRRCQISLPGQ